MTSPASGAPDAPILPYYVPIPRASLGPAVNGQGYYVGRVERNVYRVTDCGPAKPAPEETFADRRTLSKP